MAETVTGNLMALLSDSPDDIRVVFGNPSKREKRRLVPRIAEPFEKQVGAAFDTVFLETPLLAIDLLVKGAYVVVVFQVDGQGVSRYLRVLGETKKPMKTPLHLSGHFLEFPALGHMQHKDKDLCAVRVI